MKKIVEYKADDYAIYSWWPCNCLQRSGKESGRTGDQRKSWDCLVHSIGKILLDTPKGPGNLRDLLLLRL